MDRIKNRTQHLRAEDRATFLSKDLVYFQPHTTAKDGPNGDEFRKLQAATAFFERDKEYFIRMFHQCKLNDIGTCHPFFTEDDIRKCKTNNDLYERYLKKRHDHLVYCKKLNKKATDIPIELKFLKIKNTIADDKALQDLAKEVKKNAINLPRGLFKDATVKMIELYGNDAMKNAVATSKKNPKSETPDHNTANTVYLVQKYFEQMNDSYQPFYDYDRNYRTVDEWYDNRNDGAMTQIAHVPQTKKELTTLAGTIKDSERKFNDKATYNQYLRKKAEENKPTRHVSNHNNRNSSIKIIEVTPAQKLESIIDDRDFYKVYKDKVIENEKLIRHYRTGDQMLFLMCIEFIDDPTFDKHIKEILRKERDAGHFLLKEIKPKNKKSILNTPIPYELPLTVKSKEDGKEEEKRIKSVIKIKNYGGFRRFLKDRRLDSLLTYLPGNVIERDHLEWQLSNYENKRIDIFKTIYEFEKACGENVHYKKKIAELLIKPGRAAHKHLMTKTIEIIPTISSTLQERLNKIRNAFSHNQFPPFLFVKPILKGDDSFIEQIVKYTTAEYDSYIAIIKK